LRLILVGGLFGPHLTDVIALVGKQETVARIDKGIAVLKGS
jgi:glutamyl-tRNA synthetase